MAYGIMRRLDTEDQLIPGCIIRETNHDGTIPPFSDVIVLGKVERDGIVYYKLVRPYGYATHVNTCCQGHLLGSEVFEAKFHSLVDRYVILLNDSNLPIVFAT